MPGTDPDNETGVAAIGPARASELAGRYGDWEPSGREDVDGYRVDGLLSPYIPGAGSWQHSQQLDEQFVGDREDGVGYATYYLDVPDGVVLFDSYNDF